MDKMRRAGRDAMLLGVDATFVLTNGPSEVKSQPDEGAPSVFANREDTLDLFDSCEPHRSPRPCQSWISRSNDTPTQ